MCEEWLCGIFKGTLKSPLRLDSLSVRAAKLDVWPEATPQSMQSPACLHALFSPTQHGHGALSVAYWGTSRHIGWHLPVDISSDWLQDSRVRGIDIRLGGSPPTSQSTWYEQCWHCLEVLSGYCSVLEMWNRIYMNSQSVWILRGHFCDCFSSITQCRCYWLCCLFSGWISSDGNSCVKSRCLWFHGVCCVTHDCWTYEIYFSFFYRF